MLRVGLPRGFIRRQRPSAPRFLVEVHNRVYDVHVIYIAERLVNKYLLKCNLTSIHFKHTIFEHSVMYIMIAVPSQ